MGCARKKKWGGKKKMYSSVLPKTYRSFFVPGRDYDGEDKWKKRREQEILIEAKKILKIPIYMLRKNILYGFRRKILKLRLQQVEENLKDFLLLWNEEEKKELENIKTMIENELKDVDAEIKNLGDEKEKLIQELVKTIEREKYQQNIFPLGGF